MKPIEPEELSGFLDGELAPERMREVERAVASDGELREQLESLRVLDGEWRGLAADAQFTPIVRMPTERVLSKRWLAGPATIVGFLVALRLTPKLMDAELAGWLVANGIVLCALLASLAWLLKREARSATEQTFSARA